MLEISGFIADRFNNGDLLEKFTLQFDKENSSSLLFLITAPLQVNKRAGALAWWWWWEPHGRNLHDVTSGFVLSPALPYTRRWGTSRWPSRRLPPDTWCVVQFHSCLHFLFLLSVFSLVLGEFVPQFLIQIPIQLEILNSKFLILNSFFCFLQLGKYFSLTGKVIFCALSNHTTKVRQEQAAIIRFRTLRYDSMRFHMLFGSPGFLAVRPGGALWALRCVRWTTWRSFGSRCTRGRPSPSWACWGTGCVRPASWAPPHHRVVGSCGWELFLLSWQLALPCAAYLPPDYPSCRTFPFIFGRNAWIRLHLRAIPGERKVLERWTGACLLRLLRAETAYISCFSPDFACLEVWICWCCTSFLYVCLIRWCNVNYCLSVFKREVGAVWNSISDSLTIWQFNFKRVTIPLFLYIYLIYK